MAVMAATPPIACAHLPELASRESRQGELRALLERFSPRVTIAAEDACGWLDPRGMGRLFGPPPAWARALLGELAGAGWRATITLGHSPLLCRLLGEGVVEREEATGSAEKILIFSDPREELAAAAALPLDRLPLPRRRLLALTTLGITTIGEFLALPVGELRPRFGAEVAALHDRLRCRLPLPFVREPEAAVFSGEVTLEPPELAEERLIFAIKGLFAALLPGLEARNQRLSRIALTLVLEDQKEINFSLSLATPGEDPLHLLEPLRLRIAASELTAPVTVLTLELQGERSLCPQGELLGARPRRDPAAAARALDRVRAVYGDAAVTRARLCPGHLPEAGFSWESIRSLPPPAASPAAANLSEGSPRLIRRLLRRPQALSPPPPTPPLPQEDAPPPPLTTATLPAAYGAIRRLHGPHRLSGGWWQRAVERDYYYAETTGDELLWVFYDRRRQRWFLHGFVD